MANPFIVKGTTISFGGTDIKAVVVEDPDFQVGEAEVNKLTASDGTSYSFAGQEGDNLLSMQCVATDDLLNEFLDAVYGTGTTAATGGTTNTVWDLTGAGGTTRDILFTPPTTSDNKQMKVRAVNSAGLVLNPIMQLGSGWQFEARFTCDKFQMEYDTDTTD